MLSRRELLKGLFSAACLCSTPARVLAAVDHPLVMCVFPRRNIKTTYKLFSPLAKYLGESINREVKLVTTPDFQTFWKGIKERRYDIVHYNQYHYIVSNLLYGYDVILKNQEFGESTISGTLTVRNDSGIEKVEDLRGKTILFGGGKRAMQSYIMATWLLRQAGLKEGDYIEKIALNPPNAITSTYYKLADAAGSGDVVIRLDVVKRHIDISKMKYLARTPPLPHLPWAVRNDLDAQLILDIQSAMVNLKNSLNGQTILDNAMLTGLSTATDADYDEHRKIIRDVYGDDYGVAILDQ